MIRAALGAAALIAALAPAAVASAATEPAPAEFTPLLQTVAARPDPVLGSDGRYHLVYEVQLVNASSLPFAVRSLTIRADGPRGRVLARWSGRRAVRSVVKSLGTREPVTRLAPGEAAIAFLSTSVASRSRIPRAVVQQLRLRNTSKPLAGPPRVIETSAPTKVSRREPIILGPPLVGDRWLAADGCCTAPRHVRSTAPFNGKLTTPQRFAIDWERLDAEGRLFTGDPKVLANWAGYGQPVLAVADGTVVHAVNHLPDQVPGALPTNLDPADADGNGVILRVKKHRYVFYGHMIPGSVTVKPGDRVTKGQQIGLVGNSGNSSAPHLHLHVVDRNAVFGVNGLPYRFERFDITGKVASTEAFDRAEATGEPARMGPVRTGPRRNQLPLDQVIVTWP